MAFSERVITDAWFRAEGTCQCRDDLHGHSEELVCGQVLVHSQRKRESSTAWEAHHIIAEEDGGPDTLENCEIRCWPCHRDSF